MLLYLAKNKFFKYSYFKKSIFFTLFFTLLYYLDGVYYNYNITMSDCLYYSLVTQSTVGFGDIIPNPIGNMKAITILQLISILMCI